MGLIAREPLTISNAEVEAPLGVEHSTFCKKLHIGNAKFTRDVSLNYSLFLEPIEITNSNFGENLLLQNVVTRSIALDLTTVTAAFDLSRTVATGPWSIIGGQIGQLDAVDADLRDLNLTDVEVKRHVRGHGLHVRNTFLLRGANLGSDLELIKS